MIVLSGQQGASWPLLVFAFVMAVSALVVGVRTFLRRGNPGTHHLDRAGYAVGAAGIALSVLVAFMASSAWSTDRDATPGQPGSSDASSAAVVVAAPTRILLTPTETPATSQTFTWQAGDGSHTVGRVQVRRAGTTKPVTVVDAVSAGFANGDPRRHFSATVGGLKAHTAYEYRVGLDGSWSDWLPFTTADPRSSSFQFLYYGDAQLGLDTTWRSVVRMAEQKAPDAIGSLHAGDLVDSPTTDDQWTSWFAGMERSASTRNVIAVPGTHEFVGDPTLAAWKANFEYPHNNPTVTTSGAMADLAVGDTDVARQYAAYFRHWEVVGRDVVYFTDYQGVRFITLNASRPVEFLTPSDLPSCTGDACPSQRINQVWVDFQSAWLDRVLTDNPSHWSVVTFHEPVYSASVGRNEPMIRAAWVPIFERHNVDLVLMGHDHVYSRGYNNADVTDRAGVTSGPVYVVSNAGAKHYTLAPAGDNVWTANNATQVRRGGGVTTFQVIDVSADKLVYRSYLAEKVEGTTTSRSVGDIFDEFTVTKGADGRKTVTEGS